MERLTVCCLSFGRSAVLAFLPIHCCQFSEDGEPYVPAATKMGEPVGFKTIDLKPDVTDTESWCLSLSLRQWNRLTDLSGRPSACSKCGPRRGSTTNFGLPSSTRSCFHRVAHTRFGATVWCEIHVSKRDTSNLASPSSTGNSSGAHCVSSSHFQSNNIVPSSSTEDAFRCTADVVPVLLSLPQSGRSTSLQCDVMDFGSMAHIDIAASLRATVAVGTTFDSTDVAASWKKRMLCGDVVVSHVTAIAAALKPTVAAAANFNCSLWNPSLGATVT